MESTNWTSNKRRSHLAAERLQACCVARCRACAAYKAAIRREPGTQVVERGALPVIVWAPCIFSIFPMMSPTGDRIQKQLKIWRCRAVVGVGASGFAIHPCGLHGLGGLVVPLLPWPSAPVACRTVVQPSVSPSSSPSSCPIRLSQYIHVALRNAPSVYNPSYLLSCWRSRR